jgi:hypothetical protein
MDHIETAKRSLTGVAKPDAAQAHALIAIAEELRKLNEGQERSAARERNYY